MTGQETYTYHEDGSHGWLEVPKSHLVELQIHKQISSSSYKKGDKVYLEEDCDATIFMDAYETKFGYRPNLNTQYKDYPHPIRSYSHFK